MNLRPGSIVDGSMTAKTRGTIWSILENAIPKPSAGCKTKIGVISVIRVITIAGNNFAILGSQ